MLCLQRADTQHLGSNKGNFVLSGDVSVQIRYGVMSGFVKIF